MAREGVDVLSNHGKPGSSPGALAGTLHTHGCSAMMSLSKVEGNDAEEFRICTDRVQDQKGAREEDHRILCSKVGASYPEVGRGLDSNLVPL